MSQMTPPTYSPPQPVLAMSGQEGVNQGMSLANQYFSPQMGAQAQGIADIGQGQSYYNNFGPSTLADAVGNQYFNNIWPQQQAMIQNQFANSGMNFSPGLASTEANAYGNLASGVGQYEQNISNQNATNNLSDLLSINPNSYYGPITNDILNQSNTNTNMQNQYNQAVSQQQYQQAYNKYSNQNSLANTIGQISPLGGQIYGGITGTSGSAFGGTASSFGNAAQLAMMMNGGVGGSSGMQPGMMPTGQNGAPSLANSYSNGTSSAYSTGNSNGASSGYGMPSGSSMFGSY